MGTSVEVDAFAEEYNDVTLDIEDSARLVVDMFPNFGSMFELYSLFGEGIGFLSVD